MLTTFSQLSAEIEGRTYGAGVLKHEPSEATNIRMIMPTNTAFEDINHTATAIDRLLRRREFDEAQHKADTLIFGTKFLAQNNKLFTDFESRLASSEKATVLGSVVKEFIRQESPLWTGYEFRAVAKKRLQNRVFVHLYNTPPLRGFQNLMSRWRLATFQQNHIQ